MHEAKDADPTPAAAAEPRAYEAPARAAATASEPSAQAFREMKRRCWAAVVSPCEGRLTREHFVSEVLFKGKIVRVRRDGLARQLNVLIPIEKAANARVLCERHHRPLSATDAEVGKIKRGLEDQSRHIIVDLTLYQRWLCKAFCGYKSAAREVPRLDFARYAIDPSSRETRLFFSFRTDSFAAPELVEIREFQRTPASTSAQAFAITVWGIESIVATEAVSKENLDEIVATLRSTPRPDVAGKGLPMTVSIRGANLVLDVIAP